MLPTFFWKFLSLTLLLTLSLFGCGITTQDLKQEIQDDIRGTREKMSQGEKTYESNKYLGLTSTDSDKWNSTDWTMWMDTHGGGR
jgi:hypothetical protein